MRICVADILRTELVFGVPLQISIRYANVAISLFNEQGQSYIYGYIPVIVAKCGVFLKEKGMWQIDTVVENLSQTDNRY
jgi:hypothetical protein